MEEARGLTLWKSVLTKAAFDLKADGNAHLMVLSGRTT